MTTAANSPEGDSNKETKSRIPPNLYIFTLSFAFFSAGLLLFVTAMAAAVWLIPGLVQAQTLRVPNGRVLAHLFVLGWATMIAMGASYQITQVVMRTSIFSRTLGFAHFGFYIAGFLLLITGFFGNGVWIVVGGSSITAGVLLYIVNMAMTFIRKKEWSVFVLGISLSLLHLLAAVLLGGVMGGAFAWGWNPGRYDVIFRSHLWFGIGGWLSGLIIVYSFKLLPMFFVSKKKPDREAYWLLGGFHLGVTLQIVALWSGMQEIAAAAMVILIVSLGWFVKFALEVRKLSMGKQRKGVVHVALFLIPAAFLAFLGWSAWSWFGGSGGRGHEAFLLFLILGWFTATILSYLSKIFPFLWWAVRFRTKEQKKSAILLADMLPENRMTFELLGYLLGIALLVTGYSAGQASLSVTGQIVASGFAIIYLLELVRVFRH